MRFSSLAAAAAAVAATEATYAGFNYGSTNPDNSARTQSDFEALFKRAQTLQGTNGEFTSARLYTMIQADTTDTPTSAIPAAIDTKTTLLLTLWASAGQADFDNEVTALKSAINQYGTSLTSLVAAISVGSEDLYRISPTGIENDSGPGAEPDTLVSYIKQVRSAISGTVASSLPVGHVDTWTAWVNSSNDAVTSACDWIGMDGYPYFQTTMDNSITDANTTFFDSYYQTVNAAQGKPVWVTETGWPVSGPTENLAVASVANAETYWQDVACTLLGKINTWWYTLQDAPASPSFGVVGSDLNSPPLYNLACKNSVSSNSSSSSSSSASATASTSAASATAPASAAGSNTAVIATTPGKESGPVTGTAATGTGSVVLTTMTGPSGSMITTAVTMSSTANVTAPSATAPSAVSHYTGAAAAATAVVRDVVMAAVGAGLGFAML
ncbi:MAG: glycoside hydrolase family 17 protein [Acidomyces sp. 'richmondensis']|nr:MAG: glycoside hydrolase family 17 protein [Acidomyces sp. 'richmondensis']